MGDSQTAVEAGQQPEQQEPPRLFLGICDFIAWRLDLFEAALSRLIGAVQAEEPDAKFAIGYRVRDDLAFVTIETSVLSAPRLNALAYATTALPGFRLLRTQLWTSTAPEVRERGLASCQIVVREPDVKQVSSAIRTSLGNGADRRAAVRVKAAIPLRIETPGGVLETTTTDLSAGGVFIATQWPLDLGDTLPVTFFPQSRRPVSGVMTVVRHAPGGFGGRVELAIEGQAEMYRRVRALLRPVDPEPQPLVRKMPPPAEPVVRTLLGMGTQSLRHRLANALGSRFEVLQTSTALDTFHTLLNELLALDLLVIDDSLPDASARDLLFRIRQLGGETDLTIVVLTREVTAQQDLTSAGASDVSSIEQEPAEIASHVQAILQRRRAAVLEE